MKKGEPRFEHIKDPICAVEDCMGSVHKDNLCIFHLAQRSEELQKKRDEEQKAAYKRMSKKNWPKEMMKGQFQGANRLCSVCGTNGLHHVREKAKDRRPIKPKSYWECLEVVCSDCLEAGR